MRRITCETDQWCWWLVRLLEWCRLSYGLSNNRIRARLHGLSVVLTLYRGTGVAKGTGFSKLWK